VNGDSGHDQVIPRLAGAGRPFDDAGHGIQRGAFRQAGGTVGEHRTGVGIQPADGELQRPAEQRSVVGNLQYRCPIHIGDGQQHAGFRLQAARIGGGEAQQVVTGLVVAGRPGELAGAGVEARTIGQGAEGREDNRIAVQIPHRQRELDLGVFPAGLREQRHDDRGLVYVGHGDADGFGTFGHAVADGQPDVVVGAGLEEVRRPPQHAGSDVETRARRQAGRRVGKRIAIRVHRGEAYFKGLAFGHGLLTHRGQHRGKVAVAHLDAHQLFAAAHRAGTVVAVVADLEPHQEALAEHRRGGGEFHQGRAIHHLRGKGEARGQRAAHAFGTEDETVLIQIGGLHGEGELLPDQGHLVAHRAEHRRFGRRYSLQDEALGGGGSVQGAVAIAVVGGGEGDLVIAPVAGLGCEHELAGAIAVIDEAGKGRQAGGREGDRIAVRIGDADRQFQHAIAAHLLGGHVGHFRRPVGVLDGDRHNDGGSQRLAGTVALVGGSEGEAVGAGLLITRQPVQNGRNGIELGPRRQAGDNVADRRLGALEGRQGGRRLRLPDSADLRNVARVVGS
jgi:hypothetical protein